MASLLSDLEDVNITPTNPSWLRWNVLDGKINLG